MRLREADEILDPRTYPFFGRRSPRTITHNASDQWNVTRGSLSPFNLAYRNGPPLRCQQRKLAVVRRRLGRDGRQHMPGESLPPRSTGYYSPRSGLGFPGAPPKTDPPAHQWITTQPSKRPLEREAPETQPTHAAFPHTTRRKWTVKEDPDDIIDLTLDSSDTESIATPDEEPPLVNVSGDLRNTTASPPYERTASEPSIHGFSMGSTILGPLLNLTKAHRDKPRSFIRYTVDFEIGLANISAHGFVDQIHMKPRW